jgi:hypothetical protein
MTNTDNEPDPDTLRKREIEHRRIIAITNALISEVEPAPLFAAVATQLRTLYPVTSVGIAYYDDSAGAFVRGMLMTSDGVLQSIEPIPHRGTLLKQACAGDGAFIMAGERVDSELRPFVSLGETKDCADQTGVLLPLRGRTRRLLGVAAPSVFLNIRLRRLIHGIAPIREWIPAFGILVGFILLLGSLLYA